MSLMIICCDRIDHGAFLFFESVVVNYTDYLHNDCNIAQAKTTKKIVLRLQCQSCKHVTQHAIKVLLAFDLLSFENGHKTFGGFLSQFFAFCHLVICHENVVQAHVGSFQIFSLPSYHRNMLYCFFTFTI